MSPARPLAAAALALALVAGWTRNGLPAGDAGADVLRRVVAHLEGLAFLRQRAALRLGRVASGTDLGERIAFGDGAYQVGYHASRRWTERPEVYVQRSLTRALFEESGFRRVMTGDAPTLDVEVLTFEEVKTPVRHAARIALRFVLSRDRVLTEDTVAVTEPVAGGAFDDVVAAMAQALDETTDEVTRRVGSALTGR